MRPRQTLVDIFSTFLQFESDQARGWVTDAKLRRSIQKQPAPTSIEDYALYWHQSWQTSPPQPAQDHLSAYLQEACYWSTQQAMPRIASQNYGLADCFQMAISQVPKILSAFTPNQAASLKTYSRAAFSNIIRDNLRRVREIDICSDWSLLLKTSRKSLQSALQTAGLGPEMINQYITAWACFETAYLQAKPAAVRQRQAPDRQLWETVAALYNQQATPSITTETLERWLTYCAKQARAERYPRVTSLNLARSAQMQGELQDDLPASLPDTVLDGLILREEQADRQAQHQQIHQVLSQALDQLDSNAAELVKLYYQDNLTQQQMAQKLEIQQYTVSRRLSKARTALLLTLTQWIQETLHISPTSDVIKHISTVMEEWLQNYYQKTTA
jgi:RNA polymerase sigma factor (sigma-70 family)